MVCLCGVWCIFVVCGVPLWFDLVGLGWISLDFVGFRWISLDFVGSGLDLVWIGFDLMHRDVF